MSKTWVVQQDVAFALIPKAGSSSIKSTLYNHDKVVYRWNEEVDDVATRVLFLREPVARIKSAYRFFKHEHELGCKHIGNSCPTDTYEAFIDHILITPNPHWDSQTAQVIDGEGRYMPTVTHKFEDIGELWPDYSTSILNHKNSSPSYNYDMDYRMGDLMDHCKDDLDTWMKLPL